MLETVGGGYGSIVGDYARIRRDTLVGCARDRHEGAAGMFDGVIRGKVWVGIESQVRLRVKCRTFEVSIQ
jgi:hypothetical protein